MDDLDDFDKLLEEAVAAPPQSEGTAQHVPASSAASAAVGGSGTSLEDDLFDFLDNAETAAASGSVPIEGSVRNPTATQSDTVADDDFMSWLDDTAATSNGIAPEVAPQPSTTSTTVTEEVDLLSINHPNDNTSAEDKQISDEFKAPVPTSPLSSFLSQPHHEPEQHSADTGNDKETEEHAADTNEPAMEEIEGTRNERPTMNDFFDEVFGTDDTAAAAVEAEGGSNGPKGSPVSAKTSAVISASSQLRSEYEQEMRTIIHSSFPDVDRLRTLVYQTGFVPTPIRAQVWALLLAGNCNEDDEAWGFSVEESTSLEEHNQLLADCQAVLRNNSKGLKETASSSIATGSGEDDDDFLFGTNQNADDSNINSQIQKDMCDVLTLFCLRRSLEYNSVYCHLLSTLFISSQPSTRAMASATFYALVTDFIPMIGLQQSSTAFSLAVESIHGWLRLLLFYHVPTLVQHLDRVLPHWELPTKVLSASEAEKYANDLKRNTDLDELERELGLDLLDNDKHLEAVAAGTIPATTIESARPMRRGNEDNSDQTAMGCIPTHWIAGLFTGSLPAAHGAHMVDWAIINRMKFAGLFYTATLLTVFSESLLKMNASQIRQWFDEVAANKMDWYKSISVSTPSEFLQPNSDEASPRKTAANWDAFIRGWIHATAALINTTPNAFLESLQRTEEWALLKANMIHEQQEDTAVNHDGNPVADDTHGGEGTYQEAKDDDILYQGVQQTNRAGNITGTSLMLGFDGDEDPESIFRDFDAGRSPFQGLNNNTDEDNQMEEEVFTFESQQEGRFASFGTSAGLLASFRKLKQKIGSMAGDGSRHGRVNPCEVLLRNYPQSQYTYETALCLWANADEVLPCICSNRRRPVSPDNVFQRFYSCTFNPKTSNCDSISAAVAAAIEAAAEAAATSTNAVVPLCFPLGFQPVDTSSAAAGIMTRDQNSKFPAELREEDLPFFFGLDCRTPEEKKLGQFPKAYGIDPYELADSEEIMRLLDVIEPLANTVHICVIGAGADYHRWKHERANAMKVRERLRNSIVGGPSSPIPAAGTSITPDTPEVEAAINEHDNRLKSVVLFFQKRGFPHVSVLDGGFVAAARYLANAHSKLSLGGALVDSDLKALESLLGLPPSMPPQRASIVAKFETVAPAALATVGNFLNNFSKTTTLAAGSTQSEDQHMADATDQRKEGLQKSTESATGGQQIGENSGTVAAKQLFSAWGKKISMFGAASMDAVKKGVATYTEKAGVPAEKSGGVVEDRKMSNDNVPSGKMMEFDEGPTTQEIADTTGISISRTDKERAQALAIHKMAGLRKGDKVKINRQELPGAILFPSIKYKQVPIVEAANENGSSSEAPISTSDSILHGEKSNTAADSNASQQIQVHRYLVVSRERFLVLDAGGGGVGSDATVKSNRHLTELSKMTFKKKDPELVTLFFVSADGQSLKDRQYRVSKRKEFVEALQKNMERFK